MTKVVIDTNVLVSGILKQHGSEASVLNLVAEKNLTWCVSAAIVEEYSEVLRRGKFGFHPALIELWIEIAGTGFLVSPTSNIAISQMNQTTAFWSVPRRPRPIIWSPGTSATSLNNGRRPESSTLVSF